MTSIKPNCGSNVSNGRLALLEQMVNDLQVDLNVVEAAVKEMGSSFNTAFAHITKLEADTLTANKATISKANITDLEVTNITKGYTKTTQNDEEFLLGGFKGGAKLSVVLRSGNTIQYVELRNVNETAMAISNSSELTDRINFYKKGDDFVITANNVTKGTVDVFVNTEFDHYIPLASIPPAPETITQLDVSKAITFSGGIDFDGDVLSKGKALETVSTVKAVDMLSKDVDFATWLDLGTYGKTSIWNNVNNTDELVKDDIVLIRGTITDKPELEAKLYAEVVSSENNVLSTKNRKVEFEYWPNRVANGATTVDGKQLATIDDITAGTELETQERKDADTLLQTNIDNEATTRANEDTKITESVTKEISDREAADTAIRDDITNGNILPPKVANNATNADGVKLATVNDLDFGDITQERTERVEADNLLQENINAERDARIAADKDIVDGLSNGTILPSKVTEGATNAKGVKLATLDDLMGGVDISEEIAARKAGDEKLQKAIDAETLARTEGITGVQDAIDAEVLDRKAAITATEGKITAEEEARTAADQAIRDDIINGNILAPKVADGADIFVVGDGPTAIPNVKWVQDQVASVFTYKGKVDTYDKLPMVDNVVGDTYLVADENVLYVWNGKEWDRFSENVDFNKFALKTQLTDGSVSKVANRVTNVDNEPLALSKDVTAVETLANNNTTQIGEVQKNVDAEVTARTEADTALETKITDEITARTSSDKAIREDITKGTLIPSKVADNVTTEAGEALGLNKDILAEVTNREKADTELKQNLEKKVSDEVAARTSAIQALSNTITDETANREKADTAIRTELGNGTLKAKEALNSGKLENKTKAQVVSEARSGLASTTWVQNTAKAHDSGLLNGKAEGSLNVNYAGSAGTANKVANDATNVAGLLVATSPTTQAQFSSRLSFKQLTWGAYQSQAIPAQYVTFPSAGAWFVNVSFLGDSNISAPGGGLYMYAEGIGSSRTTTLGGTSQNNLSGIIFKNKGETMGVSGYAYQYYSSIKAYVNMYKL